ncbi:hypothetical protein N7492_004883 [Penicillium capsulatum]|uniref:HCNGP-like protein n=1 Tax=Penicillium capsulatum TaxID=69766 RepID=A0A9W9I8M1_9EURO|nr:hypothetical protein N7492_004883 [Penicillium capsulatum]KAJ6136009.1 hypothetical protein N7512_001169 [Penicillium capsulatum]
MLGLGAYDSSSEEDTKSRPKSQKQARQEPLETARRLDQDKGGLCSNDTEPEVPQSHADKKHSAAQTPRTNAQAQPLQTPLNNEAPHGPVLGPASIEPTPQLPDGSSTGGRSSPFSASRALVHDLTLPPVPNLDIPPSPPGSPNPAANAKFEHFLSLKKQGVHFNAKLASSSSLKNPSLMSKMMEHAGIDEPSQYSTSLPPELWSTANFPSWGFKEELLRSQQEARQKAEDKRASGPRSSVEFVSGSGSTSKDKA